MRQTFGGEGEGNNDGLMRITGTPQICADFTDCMSYNTPGEVWEEVKEPLVGYSSASSVTYHIIGACFEVYNQLGRGFSEVVYKDALEYEFRQRNIFFEREKKFDVAYKEIILSHHYFADFVVNGNVILEVKAQQGVLEDHYKQVINYLAISGCELGLLVNFGESSLKYKRIILTK